MDLNQINGIIRAVAPAALAYLVGNNIITDNTATLIVTALVAAAAAAWSWHTNKPAQVVAQAAENPSVDKVIVTDPKLAALPSPKVVQK